MSYWGELLKSTGKALERLKESESRLLIKLNERQEEE